MKRHGDYIRIAKGITAREGREGNLPTLTFKKGGKEILFYRGSSLCFSDPLSKEDIEYIESLARDILT